RAYGRAEHPAPRLTFKSPFRGVSVACRMASVIEVFPDPLRPKIIVVCPNVVPFIIFEQRPRNPAFDLIPVNIFPSFGFELSQSSAGLEVN
ncbi:hypothetical protein, partial [Glutamicibacter ardleyensis]|uniref:hypothetical protein n=1 Tax=Glutamicibacter ardleyensis TaxID=225894 RepID=UPI003F8EDF69